MKNQKMIWRITRPLTLVILGVLNTVLIRPEDVGTWKNYLGYLFLALALLDIIVLVIKVKRVGKQNNS